MSYLKTQGCYCCFFANVIKNSNEIENFLLQIHSLFHKSDQKTSGCKILLHQLTFMNKCKTSLKSPFNIFRVYYPKKTISLK